MCFAPLVASLAVSAALAQDRAAERLSCVPKDHYDPAALAEFARERMRQGDPATAQIMLARAARILPGAPLAASAERRDAPAEPPAAPAKVPAEPPPIWPAKAPRP